MTDRLSQPFLTFDDFAAFLQSLGHEVLKAEPGLEVTRRLLERVAPDGLPPAVLVAGTNGKGSVCWWLAAAFRAAGWRVGLFTSPHLLCLTERIRLNGTPVSRGNLTRHADHIRCLVRDMQRELPRRPTFFEWLTLTALSLFREENPDILILEIGLGGRLDAVNAVEPILSVITGVALDHQRFLGDTVDSIAREKMGILRPGVTAVLGPQDGWARSLSAELESRSHRVVRARPVYEEIFNSGREDWSLGQAGLYQRYNAATVVTAARELAGQGWRLPESAVREALAEGGWPGRMEQVSRNPEIWLDGAHNPQGMASVMADFRARGLRPVVVFGALRDKAVGMMLEVLVPFAGAVVLTTVPSPRTAREEEYRNLPAADGAEFVPDPERALARAVEIANGETPVAVLGSLYLVAEMKRILAGMATL